ncbi:hypothetical protein B0H15DRAFT_807828, partial [Mycena belliarum]
MSRTTIPPMLRELDKPPTSFGPCSVPLYLGDNFDGHASFSRTRNKTYWILFLTRCQGAYSLKTTCLRAKGKAYTEEEAVGCFENWDDVLVIWALHCFHRHGRCPRHRDHCGLGDCVACHNEARDGAADRIIRVARKGAASVKQETATREQAKVDLIVKRE